MNISKEEEIVRYANSDDEENYVDDDEFAYSIKLGSKDIYESNIHHAEVIKNLIIE